MLPSVNPHAKSAIWVKIGNFPDAWLWLSGFYVFLMIQLFNFICNSGPKFSWSKVKCLQIWFPQGLIWSRWSHLSQIFLQIHIKFFCYIIFGSDWHCENVGQLLKEHERSSRSSTKSCSERKDHVVIVSHLRRFQNFCSMMQMNSWQRPDFVWIRRGSRVGVLKGFQRLVSTPQHFGDDRVELSEIFF